MYSDKNSDAYRIAHFPVRVAAKRALEKCDEIARYFYKRPRRDISKPKPSKEVENFSNSAQSDDSFDMYNTDNVEPNANRVPLEINIDLHEEPSDHSFESPATNNEMQYHSDFETYDHVEVNMNENNDNGESIGMDVEMGYQKTDDHSLKPKQNNPYESSIDPVSSPEREMTPASRLSPENDRFSSHTEHSSTNSVTSDTPLSPQHTHEIIKFHGASGTIRFFNDSKTIFISVNGKTDEHIPFTFQNEIGNHSQ
ncbi:uncharacterized protein LOC129566763 [Sitodiplosis mosellana]|uniref:uncharacterized protein LOC129566763 n=1 Tax=Sitodiplosis mosellana TaxID=263140 RepID=UPI002444C778|nr:uncharacterized protein LOC129566763 [Sitodiplosis mosellana]